MEKKLEVKNLTISFRTANGKVQAVRDVSFDLYKGETLAIVGESGSGKSVTNRAIMSILAGNAIVEGGKIVYDGKDLLRIPESDMVSLRGDKLAMVFQDPLSALDPIMKIGKQITEAMLLKNGAARRNSRKEFNATLEYLRLAMIESSDKSKETADKITAMTKEFDGFCIRADVLENAYNEARTAAEEMQEYIDDAVFRTERKHKVDKNVAYKTILRYLKKMRNDFLTYSYEDRISVAEKSIAGAIDGDKEHKYLDDDGIKLLAEVKEFVEEILSHERPNFFRIGYYLTKNPTADVRGMKTSDLNAMALEYLDANFMNEFIALESRALAYSAAKSVAAKKIAVGKINAALPTFGKDLPERSEVNALCRTLSDAVTVAIDKLDLVKDTSAYTFTGSLRNAVDRYYEGLKKNPKEEKRFAKQTAKRDAKLAKGKNVEWEVVPKTLVDLDAARANIVEILVDIRDKYEKEIAAADKTDFHDKAIKLIDAFKEKASQVVNKITRKLAKAKALKLMEEVGIPEPRLRYNQYPFEFSGGMRQRIVIAIAFAADPDVLICDEPTTALDVTIQAQILELINKLKRERNLSVIFITHDLGVVANMADRIAVMYAGKIVETGTADDIFYDPRHPYTWALLSSMPDLDTNEKLDAIPGTPPNMIYPPKGDAFADRNKYAMAIDYERQPPMFRVSDTHYAATWLLHPDAPKVEMPEIIRRRIQRMKEKEATADEKR